jgi:hypothetical protein
MNLPITSRLPTRLIHVAAFALFCMWVSPLVAQPITPPTAEPFCFRGRPLPHCDRFFLFEIGISRRFPDTPDSPGGGQLNTLALGLMKNKPDGMAFGALLELGGETRRLDELSLDRTAIEVRARKWMNDWVAFDAGAGPLVVSSYRSRYGATSHVGLMLGDMVTATAGVDFVHGSEKPVTLTAGGRLGSWSSASAVSVAGVLLAAFILVFMGID